MDAPQQDGDGLYEVPMQGSEYHDMDIPFSELETVHSAPTPEDPPPLEEAAAAESQANLAQPASELPGFAHEEAPQTNENMSAQEHTGGNASTGDAGYESGDSYPGVPFDGQCARTCEPHFLNRKQVAYDRRRDLKRCRSQLEEARRVLQATRDEVVELKDSITLLEAQLARRSGRKPTETVSDIGNLAFITEMQGS